MISECWSALICSSLTASVGARWKDWKRLIKYTWSRLMTVSSFKAVPPLLDVLSGGALYELASTSTMSALCTHALRYQLPYASTVCASISSHSGSSLCSEQKRGGSTLLLSSSASNLTSPLARRRFRRFRMRLCVTLRSSTLNSSMGRGGLLSSSSSFSTWPRTELATAVCDGAFSRDARFRCPFPQWWWPKQQSE